MEVLFIELTVSSARICKDSPALLAFHDESNAVQQMPGKYQTVLSGQMSKAVRLPRDTGENMYFAIPPVSQWRTNDEVSEFARRNDSRKSFLVSPLWEIKLTN